MAHRVHQPARIQFFREAAFQVVARRGLPVSRRAIAHELGTTDAAVRRLVDSEAVLEAMAAQEVAFRRGRGRRFGLRHLGGVELARELLSRLIPEDATRIEEEVVWLRLVADVALVEPDPDSAEDLADAYQVAQLGFVQRDRRPPVRPADEDARRRRHALAGLVAEHEEETHHVLRKAFAALGREDVDPPELALARATVDGLCLAVCTGRLTPAEAAALLDRFVDGLASAAAAA